jgi:hypothetical protein
MSPGGNHASSSPKRPRQRAPENPIIQVASKALETFVVKAFGELEAKLPHTLQPGSDGERPNWQLRLLTDFMIRQLRESVSRALGTTTADDTRGRGLQRDALRAARRARRKPEPGRQQ